MIIYDPLLVEDFSMTSTEVQKSKQKMDFNDGSKITDLSGISSLNEAPWLPLASLELLMNQHETAKGKRLRDGNSGRAPSLSTARVMKLAKTKLDRINSQRTSPCLLEDQSEFDVPFEASEDLELALLLQAAAEKVVNRQWIQAEKLLKLCSLSASVTGNPVQRVVHHFSEALQERIDRDSGKFLAEEFEGKMMMKKTVDVQQIEIHLQPELMKCQQELPYQLASEAAAVQAILDALECSKKVHLIDFGANNGSHWTLIMQHLATRDDFPLKILKITVVGSCKEMLETVGNQLSSFAKSLGLPFEFLMVIAELKDLKEDTFDLEADETLAVYSEFRLATQLIRPNHLEALLRVVRNLNPCIMVIKETEAAVNTGEFMERFHEALLLCGAVFDGLHCSLEHRIIFRKWMEEVVFREMIQNMVVKEGTQRICRHERIGFWRKFLAKFGMVETDFSSLSITQANILLRSCGNFSSCSLKMDGKSLIFGWEGTSILSLSAWKFQNQ